jgi:hypothetical protein
MHGNLSRADTWNFMALAGPDSNRALSIHPVSNADARAAQSRLSWVLNSRAVTGTRAPHAGNAGRRHGGGEGVVDGVAAGPRLGTRVNGPGGIFVLTLEASFPVR